MTDRNMLLASLRLSDRRLTHTLGVEKAALTIAARHFPALREEEVSAAALLHDCTKEWTAAEQLAFCDSQGIGLDAQEKACVKVLHGRTAAVLAERTFGAAGGGLRRNPAAFYAVRAVCAAGRGAFPRRFHRGKPAVRWPVCAAANITRDSGAAATRMALEKALVFLGWTRSSRENLEDGNLF